MLFNCAFSSNMYVVRIIDIDVGALDRSIDKAVCLLEVEVSFAALTFILL